MGYVLLAITLVLLVDYALTNRKKQIQKSKREPFNS
jgi:hypothetical protein